MAALNAFKNCSNFTDEETRVIALVRGVSAAVCCGILSFVLVALVVLAKPPKARKRLCGTVIKRLTFGTFAVSVAYQLNFALHLVHYYYQDNRYCKVNGFFNQYFGSVLLLFILESILILYFKIMAKVIPSWRTLYKAKKNAFTYHGWKINKLEVLNLALIVVLPFVIDWIPFTTNSYGQYGTWCWIILLDPDCSIHTAGLWEQIWLWFIPFGFAAFLTLVLFITSLCTCVLGYGGKDIKAHKVTKVAILDYVLLLAFLVFIFFVRIARFAFDQHRFVYWVLDALGSPLLATFIPLALLVAILLPTLRTRLGKQHRRQSQIYSEGEPKSVNESDGTFYTHWTPPHSTITTSLLSSQRNSELQQY